MSRIRIRSFAGGGGSFTSTVGSYVGTFPRQFTGGVSKCTDGEGIHDGAFAVAHSFIQNGGISYNKPDGTKKLKNFMPSLWVNPPDMAASTDPGRPSNSALAVQVIRATNPSKAKLELPVSLFELRELPDLVRKAGNRLIDRVGESNLRYYFGVLPLMADAAALLQFQDSVDKRVKLLKKFRDEGPMLRKVQLYSGCVVENPGNNVQANSTPPTSNVTYEKRLRLTMRTVWGYTRWTPSGDFDKKIVTDRDLLNYARTIIPGLRVDMFSLWSALPWSWLADWYGNLGDWLEANRHVVPIYPGVPRICETIRVEENFLSKSNGFGMPPFYHTATCVTVHKSRSVVSAALPSASLPLLTPRQALILPSIAAVKGII